LRGLHVSPNAPPEQPLPPGGILGGGVPPGVPLEGIAGRAMVCTVSMLMAV
jgi:hypothetical protein